MNQVLISQKIRLFLESIKDFKSIVAPAPALPLLVSEAASFKSPELEVQKAKAQAKPVTKISQPNSAKSRLLTDLENDKLKNEDVLLIHYIMETGRFKLGTGWRSVHEADNIKIWEEIQELNSLLSTNYDNALRRFEMKNITEISETTGSGNPREISIKEAVKNELLEMSDELLSKIDVVFQNNKNTSE